MAIGRHARAREHWFWAGVGWVLAVAALVVAAVTSDVRWLRIGVVLGVVAVIPHAIAAARAPRVADVRSLRREIAGLRSELAVRAAPIVEVVVVQAPGPQLSRPTAINGNAYVENGDRRRLVLDLVALEEAAEPIRR